MITIHDVQITPVKAHDGLIAFAGCLINGDIYIGSIAIYTKLDGGLRLVYPARKVGEKLFNYHHPINSDTGKKLEDAILKKANEVLKL